MVDVQSDVVMVFEGNIYLDTWMMGLEKALPLRLMGNWSDVPFVCPEGTAG
jgi:hypothetical protein